MQFRDAEIVGISDLFADGGRVALVGPRMDFAASRLQASGFESVTSAGDDRAHLVVIDPAGIFGSSISTNKLLRLVKGHATVAIFVAGMSPTFVNGAFEGLRKSGYRLRPETSKFTSQGSLRWLIAQRLPASFHLKGNRSLQNEMAALTRARTVALASPEGDVLVYLGEGRDGEALRMHRPEGKIIVIGATYGAVDLAQSVYGPASVDYKVLRSRAHAPPIIGTLAAFYVPFPMDMPGDAATTIDNAQPLLMKGGLLAMAARGNPDGLTSSMLAEMLSAETCFTDVSVQMSDGGGLVTARRPGPLDLMRQHLGDCLVNYSHAFGDRDSDRDEFRSQDVEETRITR